MPSHWQTVALGEVADIVMGQSPSGDTVSPDRGLALLNGPTEFGTHHPTPVQFTTDVRRSAQQGDILFCVRGSTTGRMNWADQEYAIGRGIAAIHHRDEPALQPLIRGVIELALPELLAQATGSTFPNVSASQLAELPYPNLDRPEQRAIAHVLGTLDDKIELNRRMNQTLEEMARAIFQDWFVDFGPVRAKLEGREPYLPPELWDLFPDRLVESELGEIPEGWEVKAFEQLLDDVIGGDWGRESPDSTNSQAVSIIRGTDLPNIRHGGVRRIPLRYTSKKKAERRMLEDGDVIIEVSGGSPTQPTGRSMMITSDILGRFTTPVVCASFCRRLRPRGWTEGLIASQHLNFLNSIGKMWDYQLQSTGIANFQTKRFLSEEPIIWPGESLTIEFSKLVTPIIRQASRNEDMALAEKRDALLPKLVSGEWRVGTTGGQF